MPRDLFQTRHDDTPALGPRAGVVPFSIAAHVIVIGTAVLVPAIAIGALPDPRASLTYVNPDAVIAVMLPPPAPGPRPMAVPRGGAPLVAPDGLPPVDAEPVPAATNATGLVDTGEGVLGGIEGGIGAVTGTTVAEIPPPPPEQKPVRPGGLIKAPVKVRDVAPLYPDIARSARVEGIVIIEATIDTSGRVTDARLLRSVPLLDEAALAAVRQWVYTPTRLNGEPVAVVMTVTVQFRLN
jgi:periplasmic protein TonB